MPNYIIAYHGGEKPATPEDGQKQMQKFMNWVGELGEKMVNPGTPLGMSKIVSSTGITDETSPNRLTGFSIVKADDMDAALEIAKSCPFLEMGTIEVAEVMEMKPPA